MRYAVVIEKAGSNYSAYVPDLAGCVATGRTPAIVGKRIREAVAMHIAGMRKDGVAVPRPTARAVYVSTGGNGPPRKARRAA